MTGENEGERNVWLHKSGRKEDWHNITGRLHTHIQGNCFLLSHTNRSARSLHTLFNGQINRTHLTKLKSSKERESLSTQ